MDTLSALVAFHSYTLVILQALTPDTVAQLLSEAPQAFLSTNMHSINCSVCLSNCFIVKSPVDRHLNVSVGFLSERKRSWQRNQISIGVKRGRDSVAN